MQRRTALKNIGLSFGALTLTPTVVSMLQSCQNAEAGWAPLFYRKRKPIQLEKSSMLCSPLQPLCLEQVT